MVYKDAIPSGDVVAVAMEIAGGIHNLSKALGISVPAIYAWRNGTRKPNRSSLDAMYKYINDNTTYTHKINVRDKIVLTDYTKNPIQQNKSTIQERYYLVPLLDSNLEETGEEYAFRKTWLQKMTESKEYSVFMFRYIGMSMKPLFSSGSLVLINACNRKLVHKKIYLIITNGMLYVRRYFFSPTSYIFKVENNDFELQNLIMSDEGEFTVLGEVIWFCSELQ